MRAKKIDVLIRLFKNSEAQLLAKQKNTLLAISRLEERKEKLAQEIQLECNANNVLRVLAYREEIRGLISKAQLESRSLNASLDDLEEQIKGNYIEIKKCSLLQKRIQKKLLSDKNKAESSELDELYQLRNTTLLQSFLGSFIG